MNDATETTVACSKCGSVGQPKALWCTKCGFPMGKSTDASHGRITPVGMVLKVGILGDAAPTCPKCKTKGKIVYVGLTIVTKKRGMGLVTRTDTITKTVRLPSGDNRKETTKINRQERAPVVRGIQRHYYRCSVCNDSWTKDLPFELEDTEATDSEKGTVLVTKEVTKVPCKYCGNLVNLNEVSTCPNCGGRLY